MEGTLALFIPIMALSIPFFAIWTKHRKSVIEMQMKTVTEVTAEKAAQYASHSQALEDRVRVLERIVTDRGYDIATQIEALRDQRRVENDDAGVPLGTSTRERVQ